MTAEAVPPIPMLRLDGSVADPETLETWRESLSSVLGAELPHSLFALWYVGPAGVELIGPAGLGPESLPVPVPAPRFTDTELGGVEDVVRRAGYGSVLAMGITHGERDAGLVLVADFPRGLYDERRALLLRHATEVIAPALVRAVRQVGRDEGEDGAPPAAHLDDLVALLDPALPPREMAARLSSALAPQLPHDRLAIVVDEPGFDDRYRLDGHTGGTLWSDLRLVVPGPAFDAAALAEGSAGYAVADVRRLEGRAGWPPPLDEGERALRAVAGTPIRGSERVLGWLLVGTTAPEPWAAADRELLARAAALVAPRVEALLLGFQGTVLRSHLGVLRNVPASLARLAELLATTVQFGSALRLFAREASAVLPFSRLEAVLRVGAGEEVVRVEPGMSRAIADLPVSLVTGTELGRVVGGALPYALATDRRGEEVSGALIVPLRVAGRITGALLLHAQGPDTFSRPDAALAQQLADVLAPHLELARRPGGPAPSLPVPPSIRRPARSG